MAALEPAVDRPQPAALPDVWSSGQVVACRLVPSATATKLRIKVRPEGIDVVLPAGRQPAEAAAFVNDNLAWVEAQLARARQLRAARRPALRLRGQLLYRGELVPLRVRLSAQWLAPNKVALEDGALCITCRTDAATLPARSLENWRRKQARERIEALLAEIGQRLKRAPNRVYVMGQRTKWGNCSALGNLSFNWRLVMAPDEVLRYIVTHEMVHLAVPDHSPRFWLTVQSLCPPADRARQWLVANGHRLTVDLATVLATGGES